MHACHSLVLVLHTIDRPSGQELTFLTNSRSCSTKRARVSRREGVLHVGQWPGRTRSRQSAHSTWPLPHWKNLARGRESWQIGHSPACWANCTSAAVAVAEGGEGGFKGGCEGAGAGEEREEREEGEAGAKAEAMAEAMAEGRIAGRAEGRADAEDAAAEADMTTEWPRERERERERLLEFLKFLNFSDPASKYRYTGTYRYMCKFVPSTPGARR